MEILRVLFHKIQQILDGVDIKVETQGPAMSQGGSWAGQSGPIVSAASGRGVEWTPLCSFSQHWFTPACCESWGHVSIVQGAALLWSSGTAFLLQCPARGKVIFPWTCEGWAGLALPFDFIHIVHMCTLDDTGHRYQLKPQQDMDHRPRHGP